MSRTHLKRKTTHQFVIAVQTGGDLGTVIASTAPPIPCTLDDVLSTMANLAFIVETLAHLQGKPELLPSAERAREQILALQPREV